MGKGDAPMRRGADDTASPASPRCSDCSLKVLPTAWGHSGDKLCPWTTAAATGPGSSCTVSGRQTAFTALGP